MDTRPIGVFDSGLGGLTVVKQLIKKMPNESIIYFGDTGRVPYGARSNEIIEKYARQDINFLMSKNVKLIIAACGTVSSVAPHVGEKTGIPFIEVVTPAVKVAAATTGNGKIGVIGTAATISSGSYKSRIQKIDPKIEVFQNACVLFVPLVEAGWFQPNDEIVRLTAQRYLQPLIDQNVDTLILGCTHYPILAPVIADIMGDGVTLINTGETTALAAAEYMRENGLLSDETNSVDHFFVSDTTASFAQTAEILLGRNVDFDVNRIDINLY